MEITRALTMIGAIRFIPGKGKLLQITAPISPGSSGGGKIGKLEG